MFLCSVPLPGFHFSLILFSPFSTCQNRCFSVSYAVKMFLIFLSENYSWFSVGHHNLSLEFLFINSTYVILLLPMSNLLYVKIFEDTCSVLDIFVFSYYKPRIG